MDLNLSEDQLFFQETTRRFLAARAPVQRARELAAGPVGFDPEVLRQGAGLGWLSPLVPESHGGGSVSGLGVTDLAIVAEELGRVLFPGPVLETNLVAWAVAAGGSEEQRRHHLPALAGGEMTAAWAGPEGTGRGRSGTGPGGTGPGESALDVSALDVSASGGAIRLSGRTGLVPWAASVDLLLVTARTGRALTQVLVARDSPGVHVEELVSLDLTRRLARVSFADVELPPSAVLGEVGAAGGLVERQLQLAVALQSAETVGVLERSFDFTLDYAKQRKAFGRPIGSFQALKHRFSDMLLALESSKAASVAAVQAVQHDVGAAEAVSVAKSYMSECGPPIVRQCLQIHGGIGYTWEHDMHLYMRRVEANAVLYGDGDFHRDRLAVMVGLGERVAG